MMQEKRALAYWRSLRGQPKAKAYADAIHARIKGDEGKLPAHVLQNAITMGAARAEEQGLKPARVKVEADAG